MRIVKILKILGLGYIAYLLLEFAQWFIVIPLYKHIPYALIFITILEIILLFRKEK